MRVTIGGLRQSLRGDVFAGFTIAMVAIPQSIAYAAIANVGPLYGLYTAIVPAIVGSLWGSSGFLVTGPTNATALVTVGVLQPEVANHRYLDFVFALAILSGLIKLVLGVLRLGWIIRYVSNAVLTGFLAGAAILIILSQVSNFLGLPRPSGVDTVTIVKETLLHLADINPHVMATGLLTVVLMLSFKRMDKRLPAELLAIGLAGLLVRLLDWNKQGVRLVSQLGTLQNATLSLHVPALTLGEWQALLPSAGAVALFSLVEAMSIARAVGLTAGERSDPSREFIGQGLASCAGGLLQSIPSSGSPSRTAVNYSSGGRTRLAAALSGVFVLLTLVVFGWLLGYIPVPGLAGVIVVSAYNLINWHHIRLTWHSQMTSRLVMIVTFIATLLAPLHLAIYLGAVLSIAIYVYESTKLQLSYLTPNPGGGFVERDLADLLCNPPSIAIINVEGTLSFGAADDLEQGVDDIIRSGVRVIILRVRRMRLSGSEGIAALERIARYAARSGTRVLISGARDDVRRALDSSGVTATLGAGGIFVASDVLFDSTQQALARAQEIVLEERTHGD